jgi:hypothetical protein
MEMVRILRKMADTIEKNQDQTFGGVAVIIPPKDGPSIEILSLDNREDGMLFYSNIKTMAERAFEDLVAEEKKRQAYGYGPR